MAVSLASLCRSWIRTYRGSCPRPEAVVPSLDIVVSADGFFEDGPVCGSPGTTDPGAGYVVSKGL